MKKVIDFLFLSEVTAREEKSLILLTEELKRRGYTAEYLLCGEWENHRFKKSVNVLIVNSCFDRIALEHTVYTIAGAINKVVAFRWEQVPWRSQDYSYERDRIIATTKTFNTLAWGEDYCDCMRKCGVQEKYIHKTGFINLDFMRPEFQKVFESRETIVQRYNLPKKKILLFISDFAFIELEKKVYDLLAEIHGDEALKQIIEFDCKTQVLVLEWFEKLLSEEKNEWIIIYRPHPGVSEGKKALELSKRIRDFYYISELSAQQWIKIADKVVTIQSTMISDIYFANKELVVIRPYEVPKDLDNPLYEGVEAIKTYETFKSALNNVGYSIKSTNLKRFYDVSDVPTYIRIADSLELIYSNNKYDSKWDKDDLAFVKRYSVQRRLRMLDKIIIDSAKKKVKKALRFIKEIYTPRSSFLRKYMVKAENIVKHDEFFRKKIESILQEINS